MGTIYTPSGEKLGKKILVLTIHHFIHNYSLRAGGAERLVSRLHEGLLNAGYDSRIVSLVDQKDNLLPKTHCLRLNSPYSIFAVWKIYSYLRSCIQPGDIVHVHLFPTVLFLAVLRPFFAKSVKFIYTEHSTDNRRRNKWWGYQLDRLIYKAYDWIIAISDGTKEALINWQPQLRHKVKVIPNGARLHFQNPLKRVEKDEIRIISIGNLRKAKNYETALYAIKKLDSKRIHYHIAGRGDLKDHLIQKINELDISGQVHLEGFVDDIPTFLKSADIFLMPSTWEGFGLSAVEAMNASLPIVISNVPGLNAFISSENPAGILIDPQNPETIAEALQTLINAPKLRNDMGRNGYSQSLSYSESKVVSGYAEFYREI